MIHDGFTNTYSFNLEGRKVRLIPLTPHEIVLDHVRKEQKKAIKKVETPALTAPHLHLGPKGTPPYLLMAQAKEVRRAYEGGDTCFLIIYHDFHVSLFSQTELDSFPLPISLIFNEFKDMFPEEMPPELPPLRGIEHQVDFLPGVAIPNRPAYRANPKETKELQV